MNRVWRWTPGTALVVLAGCADPGIFEPVTEAELAAPYAVIAAAHDGEQLVCDGRPATIWDTMDETLIPKGASIRAVVDGEHTMHIIHGTNGPDVIVTGGGPDVVFGGNGDDVICTGGGPDVIQGGNGSDRIFAGGGPDEVYGGNGDDVMYAGGGPDRVHGGPGNDVIEGEPGRDVLFGGAGDDVIFAGAGPDQVFGEAGNDQLTGGLEPRDEMYGGSGDNILVWTGEQDVDHGDECDGGDHEDGEEGDHEDDGPPGIGSAHGRGHDSGCEGGGGGEHDE